MKLVKRFKVLYDANDKPTNIPLAMQMDPYFIDNHDWLWQDEDDLFFSTQGLRWAMRFRYKSGPPLNIPKK
jgi:hypothetical protein